MLDLTKYLYEPVGRQERKFLSIVLKCKPLVNILDILWKCQLKDCWVASSALAQIVWNYTHENPNLMYGIKDFDIAYYDPTDLSYEAEDQVIQEIKKAATLNHLNIELDIKNVARMHIWYPEKFGMNIQQYSCVAESMLSWLSTSHAFAIRRSPSNFNQFEVLAPYGFFDLFSAIVRFNESGNSVQNYYTKVKRWHAIWPGLIIKDYPPLEDSFISPEHSHTIPVGKANT